MRKRTVITEDIEDVECELAYEPVEYCDQHKARVGDTLVFAYLVYDDCYRDIDDMMGDCMGKLYSFHRHAGRDDHRAGLDALGNNSDGEPNLDAVWENHEAEAVKRYLANVRKEYSFAEVQEKLDVRSWTEAFEVLTRDVNGVSNWDCVEYEDVMTDVLTQMWSEPAYFPGDPDAQVLACYSHSGESWSLSGGGMQCRWDTSNKAGVWVPDDCLRKELDSTAPAAVWAFVRKTEWVKGRDKQYQLVTVSWENGVTPKLDSADFSDDCAALYARAASIAALMPTPTAHQLAWGREQMSRIYCKQFLDTYNDIISGNIYGCVVETFNLDGEQIDEDACWGFIGSEHAEGSLKDDFFDPTCKRLSNKLEATT